MDHRGSGLTKISADPATPKWCAFRIDEDAAEPSNIHRSTEYWEEFVDGREVDLDPDVDSDLDDKPQPPPQPIKSKSYPRSHRYGKIEARTTSTRKKVKAPGAEVEDQGRSTADQWSIQTIEAAFHKELRKLLLEDPVLQTMQVREIDDQLGPMTAPPTTSTELIAVKSLVNLLKEAILCRHRSVRMNPRPNQAQTVLKHRDGCHWDLQGSAKVDQKDRTTIRSGRPTSTYDGSNDHDRDLIDKLHRSVGIILPGCHVSISQRAKVMPAPDTAQNLGSQDVEMESAGSPGRDSDLPGWEYDSDGMDLPEQDRAAVASTTVGPRGSTKAQ
ncbi:unnamed protein product [Phytophthora fragariaefolia]|uniref:Unnamed protein product n=1 Tax=Phytophthora fragariaefolia TaxID=1490495 RepID=A0A9W7D4D9_9STRA|nr:unnamed protein product [Phytophthora fragariaefolia]